MDPERRQEIERLFDESLDRPSVDRDAWLARECAADPVLLAEVEALLAAHDLAERIFDERTGAGLDAPERIGPYRLIRELGRGGMGRVYLAERDDGHYRSRVALKLIRGDADDGQLRERLLTERQILAGLAHPNIARLLDGGVTEDGRPYLVMEYVDGLPITTHADRHRLNVDERLRLFIDVCSAVQHAHQNLVIHRDLKPGNILVTAAGQVKLLDFGIAKLLNPTLAAVSPPVTRTQFRVMTPEYASPEQVRGDVVTTASDVYTLGALLYELLAGHPPYRLASRSAVEALDLICHRDPERPSTRVMHSERVTRPDGALDEITPELVGEARGLSPERLRRLLRGDLDGIIMMALRKEPARRYASADLLRRDVEQYLAGLPVGAHRGSRRYRAGRFVRRNRVEVAAAALVLAGVLGGAGVAAWQARIAGLERSRAESALAGTEEALARSEAASDFLIGLFETGDPQTEPGSELAMQALLRRGVARAEHSAENPTTQAQMFEALGRVQYSLGEQIQARAALTRALQLRRAEHGDLHREVATTLSHLADVMRRQGEYEEAYATAARALDIRRQVLGGDHPEVARSLFILSGLAVYRRDLPGAEAFAREGLAVSRRSGRDSDRLVADGMDQLAAVQRRRGDLNGSYTTRMQALALLEQNGAGRSRRAANIRLRLADMLALEYGRPADAEPLFRRAIADMSTAVGAEHPLVAWAISDLAAVLATQGRHEEAHSLIERTIRIMESIAGPDHPNVAGALIKKAHILLHAGRLDEAEDLRRWHQQRTLRHFGRDHPAYIGTVRDQVRFQLARGDIAGAEASARQVLHVRRDLLGEADGVLLGIAHRELAEVLLRRGAHAEAETLLQRGLALILEQTSEVHYDLRLTHGLLADLYLVTGRDADSRRHRALSQPPAPPVLP